MQIIFATGNENKVREAGEILQGTGITFISMKEAGVAGDIVEDGTTYRDNALIKARYVCRETGQPAMADDSGLEIDYLDKAPGVYSARFMGEDTPYHEKNMALIGKLDGVPDEQRTARFVCAVAVVYPDGTELTTQGVMEGRIGYEEKGKYGFGYDPIFFLPQYGQYSAELDPEEKNAISHRGQAFRSMRRLLETQGENV